MPATIRDVAREAGVSVATVSRVLNGSGPVAEATRLRITEAARRLRYSPNTLAQGLSNRRSSTIGVVLPDLYGEFFSELIRGIDQQARSAGYHVLVSSSHADPREMLAALRAMRGRMDGLILLSPDLDGEAVSRSVPDGFPVVLLNAQVTDGTHDTISVDNYGGARAVTEHLLRLGHVRIGTIAGDAGNQDARERLRGWSDALAAAGVERREEWVARGDFTESSGHAAALRLLALPPLPTAIVAANDSMAVGALAALAESGVRVPEEVAVVGFDDIPIARYVTPPLTTVRVAITELGVRACARLLEVVGGGGLGAREHTVLPTELVVRRSCGGAAPVGR